MINKLNFITYYVLNEKLEKITNRHNIYLYNKLNVCFVRLDAGKIKV